MSASDLVDLIEMVENLTPLPDDEGYRVKLSADGRHHIDVLRMIYNWRLVTTPVASPQVVDRAWCYFGTGPQSFMSALLAALVWDGDDATEPDGYDKRVGAW